MTTQGAHIHQWASSGAWHTLPSAYRLGLNLARPAPVVSKVMSGGTSGYSGGKKMSKTKHPPKYGVSSGPVTPMRILQGCPDADNCPGALPVTSRSLHPSKTQAHCSLSWLKVLNTSLLFMTVTSASNVQPKAVSGSKSDLGCPSSSWGLEMQVASTNMETCCLSIYILSFRYGIELPCSSHMHSSSTLSAAAGTVANAWGGIKRCEVPNTCEHGSHLVRAVAVVTNENCSGRGERD